MAGRDQHFIPQLLQKGFSTGQTKKGKHQVWVYRRGHQPFITSTRNSFVEKDFYGPPASASLDSDITELELTLDRFLAEARGRATSHVLGRSEEAVTVAWHIASRSRWMRDVNTIFARMTLAHMASALTGHTKVPSAFHSLIAREARPLIDTMLQDALRPTGRILTEEESTLTAKLADAIEANPALLTESIDPAEFAAFAKGMQGDVLVAAARAQNHFLKIHLLANDTPLRSYLESMSWQIVVQQSPDYILGDCGPLLLASTGEPLGPVGTQVFKGFSAIALPISATHCLLGGHNAGAVVLNTAALNECAAAWSSEAFIGRADSEGNRRLHSQINSRIEPYLASELEVAFQKIGL